MEAEAPSYNIATLRRMVETFGERLEVATVSELSEREVIFVEDGNHGENRPRQDEFAATGIGHAARCSRASISAASAMTWLPSRIRNPANSGTKASAATRSEAGRDLSRAVLKARSANRCATSKPLIPLSASQTTAISRRAAWLGFRDPSSQTPQDIL